jgi:hypothetical protein
MRFEPLTSLYKSETFLLVAAFSVSHIFYSTSHLIPFSGGFKLLEFLLPHLAVRLISSYEMSLSVTCRSPRCCCCC